MVTVPAELAEIRQWWVRQADHELVSRIAGSPYDQITPPGIDNPYWEIVRQLPSVCDAEQSICPDGFARELPVGHHLLTKRYSWAIPSPGDIAWLAKALGRRGLVEVGAGSGYWAWQAQQAGIDVIAYEPADPAVNTYTDGTEYLAIKRDGHTASQLHPDRALLLCWPSHNDPWAAQALNAYKGDMLIYIGEDQGGHCADNGFFQLRDRGWIRTGSSPHHVTWRHTHCTVTSYRPAAWIRSSTA